MLKILEGKYIIYTLIAQMVNFFQNYLKICLFHDPKMTHYCSLQPPQIPGSFNQEVPQLSLCKCRRWQQLCGFWSYHCQWGEDHCCIACILKPV